MTVEEGRLALKGCDCLRALEFPGAGFALLGKLIEREIEEPSILLDLGADGVGIGGIMELEILEKGRVRARGEHVCLSNREAIDFLVIVERDDLEIHLGFEELEKLVAEF